MEVPATLARIATTHTRKRHMDDIKATVAQLETLLAKADHDAHKNMAQLRGLAASISKLLKIGKFAPAEKAA